MRIYPVLDIKNGVAVHAVRGDRKRYAPLKSRLTQSSDPLVVARAMRAQLGLNELYIADLDALQGHAPANLALASTLEEDGFQLLLDAGVADVQSAQQVRKAGVDQVIVALETLPDPKCLGEIVRELGDDSVLFSLDLKDGVPLGDTSARASASSCDSGSGSGAPPPGCSGRGLVLRLRRSAQRGDGESSCRWARRRWPLLTQL